MRDMRTMRTMRDMRTMRTRDSSSSLWRAGWCLCTFPVCLVVRVRVSRVDSAPSLLVAAGVVGAVR